MSAHAYSEERIVEEPAIALFAEMGWRTASAMEEKFGAGGTLGRETSGEVVLVPRLRTALEKLNPNLPSEAIAAAVEELARDRTAMTLAGANRETWGLIRDGVKVLVADRERGGVKDERVRVVDWEDPAENDFLLVSQMTVTGQLYTCRPDLIGFVNGLPWVVIELKKPGVPARQGFDENLTSYKHSQNGVPLLFACNAVMIASNGTQSRIGSITADWERFAEWKRIEREDEPRRVSLEVMLRGTCDPGRLLDIAENFTLFSEHKQGLVKALALNMRAALPNALFLAFTGTPLIAGEERTKEVFGDYVSIYDFQQSIEDDATVPLFYENRTPELQLVNPDLNEEMYELIENATLDPEQESRLEKELSRQYHLITRDDRLDTVAKDIGRHFAGRGFQGKAMVVSIDKATALRMYEKVRKHWPGGPVSAPDMAVIVSPGQNEIEEMKKLSLDIVPHRKRMREQALDEKFKDPDDPLRLVFVCAMWLTGFDAPSCSTIYLDKPMRNHTLMQTIARANRVYPGKHSGLIVDYANVFASLERALAIYAKGQGGDTPVRDKKELVAELRKAVAEATVFCKRRDVDLDRIEGASAVNFARAQAVEDGANRLMAPEAVKRDFMAHARLVDALYGAVKPDPVAVEFAVRCGSIRALADFIRNTSEPPDISHVLQGINELLDRSIGAEPFKIKGGDAKGYGSIDLSKIDFEKLAKRFEKKQPTSTDLERLKAAVKAQLERMVRLNRTRADYLDKFLGLIDDYNNGSRNIEEIFRELVAFSQSLTEEQDRHVRERLSEEELTIFDILTRPGPELSTGEREEVKKVARQLLDRLHEVLVLGWRQKIQARSKVRIEIENVLDEGLPRAYGKEMFEEKCGTLFEHVFESYQDRGESVFTQAR